MTDIEKKYLRRAKIIAKVLSFVPFVRMIGLNGSLARGEAKMTSDIDFFVVLKTNRFWTGRAFVLVVTHLTGFHRYRNKIAGRICLNTFQSDEYLIIGPKNQKNARDYSRILILFSVGKLAKKFFQENSWITKKGYLFINKTKLPPKNSLINLVRWFFEALSELFLNDWGEKTLRTYQIKRILADPRTLNAKPGQIYISDRELRFHPSKMPRA